MPEVPEEPELEETGRSVGSKENKQRKSVPPLGGFDQIQVCLKSDRREVVPKSSRSRNTTGIIENNQES